MKKLSEREQLRLEVKERAESDLLYFAKLVLPHREYGAIHEELFQWWTRQEALDNQLCLLPRDHQKALRLDQAVKTPEGWEFTGDLRVGDKVMSPTTGKEQTVLKLHPIEEMSLWELELDDGRKVKCNDEHLWNVECPSNWGKGVVKTLPLRDIRKNYLSDRLDKRNGKVYKEQRYFIYPTVPLEYGERELNIDPYTLGVWLGDGSSAGGSITTADPEILEYIPYKINKWKSKYLYGVEGLHTKLVQGNLLNNKHIPYEYLHGSLEQRTALLQGLLDTDGFAHKVNKNLSYTTISKVLKKDVVELVRSLGGKAKVHDAWTTVSKDSEELFHSYTINIWLPESIQPFKLERKLSRVKPMRIKSAIVNIKQIKSAKARCITVSEPDGLFITEDYVVTHNSHCAAVYAAWLITKEPWATILYVSATADLAEKQLYAIKNILDSKVYKRFWPNMIDPEEGKREKWSAMEIMVDHPDRIREGVRDPTVKAAGLTTNITGFHANYIFLDDIVVPLNAYTEDGRRKVETMYSQLASIKTTGAKTIAVGTRYHPKDIYAVIQERMVEVFKDGEIIDKQPLYEVFQRVVEEDGEFLWPKKMRADGRYFGFDDNELAKKRAEYIDRTQFFAQYYNNPNDPDNARIQPSKFQYYDRKHVEQTEGSWFYKGNKLNVFAAIDFAFSLKKAADYTAIVVVGIDSRNNYYVLDVVRFKTNSIKDYFEEILQLHTKWAFRKLRAEVTVAQEAIVKELKNSYIKPNGLVLSIDEYRPSRHEGTKEERITATLSPRYDNLQVWHYKGGNCQILEEELTMQNPPHDDVMDALTAAIDVAVAPSYRGNMGMKKSKILYHKRFGGVR